MKNQSVIILTFLMVCVSIRASSQDFDQFQNLLCEGTFKIESSSSFYNEKPDYYPLYFQKVQDGTSDNYFWDSNRNKGNKPSIESNWNSGFDLYEVDSYGMKHLSKSYEPNWIDGFNIYEYDNWGIKNRTDSLENSHCGGYDIYKYDDWGMKRKVGIIEKKLY